MSLFRRALVAILGVACMVLATAAFGPVAHADPPEHAQNDGNGNSDSPGPGNGEGDGDGSTDDGSTDGATAGGSSDSNPDGGGLDKPDCEGTAEGCQGPAPRDGNNGCGNEDEPKEIRDDDNNGN